MNRYGYKCRIELLPYCLLVVFLQFPETLHASSRQIIARNDTQAIASTSPREYTKSIKLNGGLVAEITEVSLNDNQLVIQILLSNPGPNTLYLLHVGPAQAIDNAGGTYKSQYASGINNRFNLKFNAPIDRLASEIKQFMPIEPGTSAPITYAIWHHNRKRGSVLSFSTVLAARIVKDRLKDNTLSDLQKAKDIQPMNIGFSSVHIRED